MSAFSDDSFKEDLFNSIIKELKPCFTKYYQNNYHDEDAVEFKSCCTSEEKEVLKRAINIAKQNVSFRIEIVYAAIIIYYYVSIVLEYYIAIEEDTKDSKCLDNIKRVYGPDVNTLITQITTSDEEWASQIRRLINNMNEEQFTGGKFKRKRSKRRITKRRITKRRIVKRRKTKRKQRGLKANS